MRSRFEVLWREVNISDNEITSQVYWAEVQSCAREILKQAQDTGAEIHDLLHETVDSHHYIIYTYANLQVLVHSKNDNAYFDETGDSLNTSDFSSTVQTLAFYVFQADIAEAIAEMQQSEENTQS